MSSIADALKRAQQERDRAQGRPADSAAPVAATAPARAEPSLASVVLRKEAPPAPHNPSETSHAPANPVATALKSTAAPARPVRPEQRHAETIVEDFSSKRKLNLPPQMVVYHDRAGQVAEQYRRLRDSLMADNAKRDPRLLVISSSAPGEGKTTTVLNLGLALAEVRANRVLLIDAHLHGTSPSRRSLTNLLHVPATRGFAELLANPLPTPGPTDPANPLESFFQPTPWHNLFILPAGARTTPAAAAELLQGETLRAALRHVKSAFNWILIDAPAGLDAPDASLLAAPADALLLAAALHHTPQQKIQATLRRFRANNTPVHSVILTRA